MSDLLVKVEEQATGELTFSAGYSSVDKLMIDIGITEKNCRICAHSTALPDSTWRCEKHNADGIPLDFQRKGCADFDIHDHLLPF